MAVLDTLTPATGRVLLVDDSPLAAEAIGSKLAEHGLDVVTVTSPLEALELATGQGSPFDLFILDVMMPEMDGHELTRRLRAHPRSASTPILLLTSLDSTDDRVAGLDAGADDFFTKAVPDATMLARVRSFVSLGQMRAHLLAQREAMAHVVQAPEGEAAAAAQAPSRVVVVHQDEAAGQALAQALRTSAVGHDGRVDVRAPSPRLEVADAHVLVSSYAVAMEGLGALLTRFGFEDSAPPVLVVDEAESTERRVAAFDAGADDYLGAHTPPSELGARVASALRRQRRHRELRSARDRAALAAVTDPLTGLHNRGYFQRALEVELRRAARYQRPVCLVMLDLDHFKKVNDTLGHAVGDQALREVAARLQRTARSTDVVARYGGEEFVLILTETNLAQGTVAAERLRAAVDGLVVEGPGGAQRPITISVGVAACPEQGSPPDELIALADGALYAAKRSGRNRVCVAGGEPQAPPTAPPPPAGPPLEACVERLRGLLSDDLESPLASVRTAARMLHDATDEGDSLRPMAARLCEASDEAQRELGRLLEDLARLAEARR